MPNYTIKAPNGKTYTLAGPVGATREQVIAEILRRDPSAGEAPGALSRLGNAVVRGAGSLIDKTPRLLEELPQIVDELDPSKPVKDWVNENLMPEGQRIPSYGDLSGLWKQGVAPVSETLHETGSALERAGGPRVSADVFTEYQRGGVGSAFMSLAETVAEGSPSTLAGLVTGALTRNPAAAMAVMGITSAPQEYTSIRETQDQTGKQDIRSAVIGAAAVTALDTLLGSGRAAANIGSDTVRELFEQGLRSAAKETLKTGATEGGTEVLQNVIEQVAGGAPVATKQALLQDLEAGLAGALGGTVFGGVSEGYNALTASRTRKAIDAAPAIVSVDVMHTDSPDLTPVPMRYDIISAPTDTGEVIARTSEGYTFTTTLDNIEQKRVKKSDTEKPLAEWLTEAVATRNADTSEQDGLDAQILRVLDDPEDAEAFSATVDRYANMYGLPRQEAAKAAIEALGLDKAPEAPPAPVTAAPTIPAPAPAPAFTPDAMWANKDHDVPIMVLPEAPQRAPDGTMYQKVRGGDGTEGYVPLAEVLRATPATEPQTAPVPPQPEAQGVDAVVAPAPVPTPVEATADPIEVPPAPVEDMAPIEVPPAPVEDMAPAPVEEAPELDARLPIVAKKKVTPERINIATTMLEEALALPQYEWVGAELNAKERANQINKAAQLLVRDPVLGVDGVLDKVGLPATPQDALAAADEYEQAPDIPVPAEDVQSEVAPEPEKPAVQVTKLPPGEARGIRKINRGSQGTSRGRPVEGAKQLTEGMKVQQQLLGELTAARDRLDVSDKDVSEITSMLRPPTSPIARRALPPVMSNLWVENEARQRDVDAMQERVNVVKKTDPEHAALAAQLGELQKKLDEAQTRIVSEARQEFERRKGSREDAATQLRQRVQAIAREHARLKDQIMSPELTAEQRAELREKLPDVERALWMGKSELSQLAVSRRATTEDVKDDPTATEAEAVTDAVDNTPEGYKLAAWLATQKALTPFQRLLARRIERHLLGMAQVGRKTTVKLASNLKPGLRGVTTATDTGVSIKLQDTTVPGQVGVSHAVLLHELLHAATIMGVRADTPAARDLRSVFDAFQQTEGAADFGSANTNLDEFLNAALTRADLQSYLNKTHYKPKVPLFKALVRAVGKLLGFPVQQDSMLAEVVRTANSILAVTPREPVKPTTRVEKAAQEASLGLKKALAANDAAGFTAGLDAAALGAVEETRLRLDEKIRAHLSGVGSTKSNVLSVFTPTTLIRENIARVRPELGKVLSGIETLEQKFRGMRASMQKALRRRAQELDQFNRKYKQTVLAAVMTAARVNRVDVSPYSTLNEALAGDKVLARLRKNTNAVGAAKREKAIRDVWALWEALGKQDGGHKLYKQTRQFYADMYHAMRAAQDRSIRALGLDPEATENLLRAARMKVEEDPDGNSEFPGVPEDLFPREYFPFRRFGEYALLVSAGHKANQRERYHFDTRAERDLFWAKHAKKRGLVRGTAEYRDTYKALDGLQDMQKNLKSDSLLLTEMFKIIDAAPEVTAEDSAGESKVKQDLKNQLYQTYLMSLPERNLRKQFLHAEFVTGNSADVVRIFKVSADQYATQLARATYTPQLERSIEAAYETLQGGDPHENVRLRSLLNRYVKSTRDTMDPSPQAAWEQHLSTFTFFNLMSSVASAIVQPMAISQAVPRMASRYGYVAATKALHTYSPVFSLLQAAKEVDPATGKKQFVPPSIGNTDIIKGSPLRARLWKELLARDLFSQKHSDMLMRNRPTKFHGSDGVANRTKEAMGKFVEASGAIFSSADQITREVTGMAFAELEYNKARARGDTHEEAIAKAVEASVMNTDQTIGNYTEFDKPTVFRGGPIRRMMGFLRTWAVQRIAYYFRMARAIYAGDPTQTRLEALHELGMATVFTTVMAGAPANFGFSAICMLVDAVTAAVMDDDDKKEWQRVDLHGYNDSAYRFKYQWLPTHFGNDSIATKVFQRGALSLFGGDFSTRLSQNELLFRQGRKEDSVRDTVINYIVANFSPHVSLSGNILDGLDQMVQGHWSKGASLMAPALIRGAITAERQAREGETTKSGYSVAKAEEFEMRDLIAQVLGFTPTMIAEIREQKRGAQGWQDETKSARDKLFRSMREVLEDPNSTADDVQEVWDEIEDFNDTLPRGATGKPLKEYRIDRKDVAASLRSRKQREENTYRGVELSPGEEQYLFPDEYE